MKYISLGGNCSITYHLIQNNLRTESYPFDWCKVKINHLIKILENNFIDYENIIFNKYSENHNSLLLKNVYGVQFAHEINNHKELENFKDQIINRINRFRNITEEIIFIRIELQTINKNYEKKINELVKQLDKYFTNYKLKLILNYNEELINLPKNVIIYKFNEFDEDWKMNKINWSDIFY
jgi:hypothetical protein